MGAGLPSRAGLLAARKAQLTHSPCRLTRRRREIARGDRVIGMAAAQAAVVHQGVVYDLQVDTSHTEALECARAIAACVE